MAINGSPLAIVGNCRRHKDDYLFSKRSPKPVLLKVNTSHGDFILDNRKRKILCRPSSGKFLSATRKR